MLSNLSYVDRKFSLFRRMARGSEAEQECLSSTVERQGAYPSSGRDPGPASGREPGPASRRDPGPASRHDPASGPKLRFFFIFAELVAFQPGLRISSFVFIIVPCCMMAYCHVSLSFSVSKWPRANVVFGRLTDVSF